MTMLERPAGDLFYDVCDIVPPWCAPKETILFLNGLAIDADIWVTWLPELVDRFRVVRTDLRGFGRSFVPVPGATWSIDRLAGDVLDVMAATETERVHFVGESTGGTVGLHLAAYHADALHTVTTVSAAHRGASIELARELRDEVESLGMDVWSEKLMGQRFHPDALSAGMYEWFHEVQRHCTPHACADLVDMLVATDLSEALPGISTPTLILAPDDSPFVAVEMQVARLRALADAELQIVAGARHGVSHSHGPACARVLREFLERRGYPATRRGE